MSSILNVYLRTDKVGRLWLDEGIFSTTPPGWPARGAFPRR